MCRAALGTSFRVGQVANLRRIVNPPGRGSTEDLTFNPVNLRCQNEIAFRKAIHLMRINTHFGFPPAKQNVGMVGLLFSNRPGAIHEIKSGLKVRKLKSLAQMMLVNDFPARNLARERSERFTFESGYAALARNTNLVGKLHTTII